MKTKPTTRPIIADKKPTLFFGRAVVPVSECHSARSPLGLGLAAQNVEYRLARLGFVFAERPAKIHRAVHGFRRVLMRMTATLRLVPKSDDILGGDLTQLGDFLLRRSPRMILEGN